MKRIVLIALVLAAALVLVPSAPADAGLQNSLTIEKVVIGSGPIGPYEIQSDCNDTITPFFLDAGELDSILVPPATCIVTEPNDQGATTVTYSCSVQSGTAACSGSGESVQFFAGTVGSATITVTNTFGGPGSTTTTTAGPTTTTTTTAAAAPAAAAVVATPAFTG